MKKPPPPVRPEDEAVPGIRLEGLPGTSLSSHNSRVIAPNVALELGLAPAPRVKLLARKLGFDPVGITSAQPFSETEAVLVDRIRQGLMDGLPWFHESRVRRGCNPDAMLSGARSIISLALSYDTPEPATPDGDNELRGHVSRYAWGPDYHKVMERRVKTLVQGLQEMGGSARFYVDYGPVPDRAVAARAGVGWHGKNSNVLTTRYGSWVFLADIITDLDLAPDRPLKKSCGGCSACIPSCPTGAIVAPYVIDNTRCISYQTIENKGPIPRELRPLMGDWVFGCDICQDVCPVNHHAKTPGDSAFAATWIEQSRPDLQALLGLNEEDFGTRFRGSPVRRAGWAGLLRNACVALGNSGSRAAIPALSKALAHPAALVRGHAAWALGRLGGASALDALDQALLDEREPSVLEEIILAMAASGIPSLRGPAKQP